MYDVIIVGAGVTGCAVARYLSRCQGSFLVLEREEDVCCGTSKANSAIVHAGFDAAHGSLMAKFWIKYIPSFRSILCGRNGNGACLCGEGRETGGHGRPSTSPAFASQMPPPLRKGRQAAVAGI